uniref:non-specific serine/threonine protein kinase n=1 Tax=Elaeis guineensis var. tenera TaxID=51953 RepID=A0A6J0PCG8_ELAGV|nr:serine/threonine-protein kinase SMG1 isoform X2 [Elaeis guineensis]
MQSHLHHHHLQQQLAALLSAAADGADSSASSAPEGRRERDDDAARVAALDSLQRTILYPPNALLLSHSAPFLSQGLSQLLSDRSYAVRRAAVVAYGSLCAVVSSTSLPSNALQSHVLTGGLADRFVGWALPLLGDIGVASGSAQLALEGFREFLHTGDASSIDRFIPPILKACQELLEDERTSLNLLHQLLGLLSLISLKFGHCFQPHFADIVDLLLGWAFVPNLSESDRHIIMDSFLQFQKHWLSNIQFSLGLLSKFLGDMEVLIQDMSLETLQQFARLLALFSCFSTVLQVMASGLLEMNLLEMIREHLESMAPRLLRCISTFGGKFGWSKWIGESWRCLILLAEILQDRFSSFYAIAIDILFQSLRGIPPFQIQAVLKTNLQLLSLQKLGLLSSSVQTILQFESPLSQLRLHPNHLVVANSAATYLFFLEHGSDGVVSQAITCLTDELELLKGLLGKIHGQFADLGGLQEEFKSDLGSGKGYSELELLSLMKFDLKVLQSSVSFGSAESLPEQMVIDTVRCERQMRLTSFILQKLDPFKPPIQGCLELQVHVVRALQKFSEFEFLSKLAIFRTSWKKVSGDLSTESQGCVEANNVHPDLINEYLRKYGASIARALDVSSPLAVKLEALVWIRTFGQVIRDVEKDADLVRSFCEPYGSASLGSDLLFSILNAAYDRESKVRSHVATVLEALMQAHLIDPGNFYCISKVVLDKLGDPDRSIKNAFLRVLSVVLPVTIYSCGLIEDEIISSKLVPPSTGNQYYLNWKHTLALKQLPRKLQSQQLVSILGYISQRWKVPLSSWIQRLAFTCCGKKDVFSGQQEVVGDAGASAVWKDARVKEAVLENICPVNILAAVWWSIHEAARHCIALRLRTNLGGPTQTFAALERMLLDIPNVLLLDAEQGDSKYIGSSNLHLLPMWLLLDFVEALKKNVYNAYEGSSVLPASPRSSSLFFRANKKVCEEWFSRICEPMMNAGLALHCHHATLHYGALRLQELRNLVASAFKDKTRGPAVSENLHDLRIRLAEDVLRVLRYASLALCSCRDSEALIGLQKWVTMTFSSLFQEDIQPSQGVTGSFGHLSWMTGLVHQAQGHYESAAAYFSHLLQSEDALSSLGSDGIQFVIARVIECYTSICDWKSLENWLTELQALRAMHAGKAYSGALTTAGNELNAIHALARFDEGDFHAAWGYLDLTPKSSCELTLDPRVALDRSEQMLLRSMLRRDGRADKVLEELDKAKLMLDEALAIVPLEGLTEAGVFATQLHCIFAFEEGMRLNGQHETKHFSSLLDSLHHVLQSPISRVHQDCSLWIKVFRVYRTMLPTSTVTLLLCQKLLSLARKQRNFMLADRMNQYIMNHPLTSSVLMNTELLDLNLQYEGILLKHAEGKNEEALLDLWSLVRDDMLSTTATASATGSVLKAKACLKLSNWLRQENPDINLHNILFKICEDFHACNASDNFSFTRGRLSFSDGHVTSDANYHAVLEEIVGTATKLSCHLCPTMGKTWLSYASWCFSQAKDSLSVHGAVLRPCLSPILNPELTTDRYQLTEDEKSKVEVIMKRFCHIDGNASDVEEEQLVSTSLPENEACINSLVQQAAYLLQAASGAPGFESCDGECPSVALSSQLQVLFLRTNAGLRKNDILSLVNELIDIWWSLRHRRVSLFGHAAGGYFQYLTHASSTFFASSHGDVMKEKTRSCTLRAMLYVLHIIVNYGFELKEILEHGLRTVPLLPWQEITPQLFARLSSHPKQVVRKQLEGLLMMLAKLSPCSIVYPTLVDLNACEGDPSEELQRLFDCLNKLYPKLIQDVQLVINELGSITVLWEEQWLSTLQDLHTDVIRRINLLKEEATRIAANSTLSHAEKNKINAAKYSAMMAPIIVALERRLTSTSREPKTVHELWFHKEYGEQLKSAILSFKTPPGAAMALGDVWRPFNTIAASLATRHRKSVISLNEVAPQLALLSSSDVPMPGFEKQNSMLDSSGNSMADIQGLVTISSFCEQLTILSTKTKPKKLVLRGSDGQNYTYLLKGREDLRLDARIMQMLQAVNSFCYSCTDTRSRSISVRYYSVTPISGRAGLIQWVDNVTSIYSVYKSWQTRTQISQLSAAGAGNANNQVPPVPRPSDMFYGKIIPALKEKGIRRVISRRDWPLEVKRKVLLELMKETPRQLLWQEMWCASEGFRAFTLKAKRFSGSVAAMSMVGHILGLGDRHLDNILMDFCSGDVVHIDYNVCFDKGRRLKIPEIVPFRLTQIIQTALGLTGTEGTFRANCEAVMSVLQKNKDIILMLLEVFVWDPLVEWTRGDSHDEAAIGGEEKKGMELAVSLSLFASRVQEIRVPLQEHHDLLVATLPAADTALKRCLDVLNQYEVISAIFYHADKERSSLLQHETSAKSVVAEAKSILETAQVSFEVQAHEFAQAKAVAADKSQELAMWVDQHKRVLDALRSGSVLDMQACIKLSSMEEALSLTSAVLVSEVPLTIVPEPTRAQCYDLDREVSHIVAELEKGLSCAMESLHDYALALQRILPLNYTTTSPVSGWAHVLQLSVNNISSDILSLARKQAADIIAKTQVECVDLVQQRHRDLFHKMERYIMDIEKVNDECSELMNSIGSDTEAKSKERLLSVFTKYMQSAGYSRNEDDTSSTHSVQKYEGIKDFKMQGDLQEKKVKMLSVLSMAVNELYKQVKVKVIDISNKSTGRVSWRTGDDGLQPDSVATFHEFEEQIEKCVLVAGFVNEVQQLVDIDLPRISTTADDVKLASEGNWVSVFQTSIHSSKHLIEQMTEVVLPEIIKSTISYNSEAMEAFGSLSQIRGSIDTALEKLAEVELERASLVELEKNYFVKVGLITEKQLALEEAAVKGRDHLSWEEAEELASQEEACRVQLDQLHQTWNQKDMRSSSLTKIESNVKNSLVSSERFFASVISMEKEGDLYNRRSKALLAALVEPFSKLESIDQMLLSYGTLPFKSNGSSSNLADFGTSSTSLSESMWGFASLLKNHAFFVWKLYNVLKKKLGIHLQEQVNRYLKERVAPALLAQIDKENENLQHMVEARRHFSSDQVKRDSGPVRRVQLMLEEYCNAHETVRAAKSAISLMKRQVNELTEALGKTILEIVQMGWLHDLSLPYLLKTKVLSQNILGDDEFLSFVLNLSRPKLLEGIQSSMSTIARSLECLQACEGASLSTEGQLERAMGWACAGPNVGAGSSSAKGSGIPSEFHDHLLRRRQLLWAAREQASDIMKICTSVMEFEVSRDGLFWIPGDKSSGQTTTDGRTWQQAFLNALTRLDVAYQSFTRAEEEWKLAQNNMEAAASGLFSATNELCIASVKAKSASGDLNDTLAAMWECANEAIVALSAFSHVSKGHTALTTECGSMLEEVLAITEGLHDIYSLGKEASIAHSALMADLSKANMILLPIEASLSADLAAMADVISKEGESNADVSLIHGQALYQSYIFRLREACQSLVPLVPSLTYSVKELHSTLTKLARASSLHAGNLHKALEGLGESQVVRSQDLALSRSELSNRAVLLDKEVSLGSSGDNIQDLTTAGDFSLLDEGWISPPEHTYTSSRESNITFAEASFPENLDKVELFLHGVNAEKDSSTGVSSKHTDGLQSAYAGKPESECPREVDSANSRSTVVPPDPSMQALSLSNDAVVTHLDSVEEIIEKTKLPHNYNEQHSLKQVKGYGGSHDNPSSYSDSASRIIRGKNAYALSVLRQVELKIDGRDVEDIRSLEISEQVDFLVKQATNIDNLCNMYEGWTPWI